MGRSNQFLGISFSRTVTLIDGGENVTTWHSGSEDRGQRIRTSQERQEESRARAETINEYKKWTRHKVEYKSQHLPSASTDFAICRHNLY